ncbi:MAG: very short patch repair endonuclease [bacterium]
MNTAIRRRRTGQSTSSRRRPTQGPTAPMDRITPERRSWNMSRVRSKNTKPERAVQSLLHRMGYRFTLSRTDLPGKPDIVLPKHRTALFVHGCFWHQHPGCKHSGVPLSNRRYWRPKLRANVERDANRQTDLLAAGWRTVVLWECQIEKDCQKVAQGLNQLLGQRKPRAKLYQLENGGLFTASCAIRKGN